MILEYAKAVKNGEQTCKILGGGGIQQNLIWGGSARGLTTCPCICCGSNFSLV